MKIPGYSVHRKIGQGGMAAVYLATQESFGRKVALKIIANKAFGSNDMAQRFQREAKIIAGLSHPHIVPVYDAGSVGQYQFLAMDHLSGGDLSGLIKAGLTPQESLNILGQIAQALHYAHAKGYVHRDVKPDNIMFREDLSAVLTDFGIAKPQAEDSEMTRAGKVFGSPAYMSPEQCQSGDLDGRSDLYALGIILYSMLTRTLPYRELDPMALALQHIRDPIPQLPSEFQAYQALLEKLMAKEPEQRFQSGLELSKAIKSFHNIAPVIANSNNNENDKKTAGSIELSLSEKESPQDESQQNFCLKESSYRIAGLLKRYSFDVDIRSQDGQHFSILFGQFTTELLNWQQQRAKRAGRIRLNCYIGDNMLTPVKKTIAHLCRADEPFEFLEKLRFEVAIFDGESGVLVEQL